MDPASIAAITFILGAIKEYGPLAVGVVAAIVLVRVVAWGLVQAWVRGDFLSRKQHEEITRMYDQRILDGNERFRAMTEERDLWRDMALHGATLVEGEAQRATSSIPPTRRRLE